MTFSFKREKLLGHDKEGVGMGAGKKNSG